MSREKDKFLIRVYYQDTDAGGVVYHSVYLNFFERGRTEWLRQQGINLRELNKIYGITFIVRKLDLRYRKPAVLDDLLQVETMVTKIGRFQMTILQCIKRGGESLVEANINLGLVSSDGIKPRVMPEVIRNALVSCNQL